MKVKCRTKLWWSGLSWRMTWVYFSLENLPGLCTYLKMFSSYDQDAVEIRYNSHIEQFFANRGCLINLSLNLWQILSLPGSCCFGRVISLRRHDNYTTPSSILAQLHTGEWHIFHPLVMRLTKITRQKRRKRYATYLQTPVTLLSAP